MHVGLIQIRILIAFLFVIWIVSVFLIRKKSTKCPEIIVRFYGYIFHTHFYIGTYWIEFKFSYKIFNIDDQKIGVGSNVSKWRNGGSEPFSINILLGQFEMIPHLRKSFSLNRNLRCRCYRNIHIRLTIFSLKMKLRIELNGTKVKFDVLL